MRIPLHLTDVQIDTLALHTRKKTVLHALHVYGAYVMDKEDPMNAGHVMGLINVGLESIEPIAAYGRLIAISIRCLRIKCRLESSFHLGYFGAALCGIGYLAAD